MKIKEIMSKELVTLRPDDSFVKAAKMIVEHHVSGLPVVDEEFRCVGIISEKDLLENLFPAYRDLMDAEGHVDLYKIDFTNLENNTEDMTGLSVNDMLGGQLVFIDQNQTVSEAAAMMILYKVRRLPVNDGIKLVGIISQGDVFRAIINKELSKVNSEIL